ncbi:MAG: ribonuclease P protein component [Candidatus Kapabacteria bacterium]|nr:ribonuclease P protein component [Candidatus Kapabacteria bacterium]MDW8011975.1 ribonuclease P protein component [Bacteroidota bacterium]
MVSLHPLKRRKDIEGLWEKGQRYAHPMLTLVVLPTSEGSNAIGYVVSVPRRRVRKAVLRNRLRRLLREGVRRLCQEASEKGLKLPVREIGVVWRGSLTEEELRRLRLSHLMLALRELFQQVQASNLHP